MRGMDTVPSIFVLVNVRREPDAGRSAFFSSSSALTINGEDRRLSRPGMRTGRDDWDHWDGMPRDKKLWTLKWEDLIDSSGDRAKKTQTEKFFRLEGGRLEKDCQTELQLQLLTTADVNARVTSSVSTLR